MNGSPVASSTSPSVVYRWPWAWTLSVSHSCSGPNSPARTFASRSAISSAAAQLYDAAAAEVADPDEKIRAGEFGPLHGWLTDNVHAHGRRHTTDELVEEATGEPFTADFFLDYAESKFGALYELDAAR